MSAVKTLHLRQNGELHNDYLRRDYGRDQARD